VGIDAAFRHPVRIALETYTLAEYRELFPARAAAEVHAAQSLLAHRFDLLGQPVATGGPLAWSRDPISGRDWPREFSPDIRYRGDGSLGDIKFPWELSKHQYFFTLGKSGWLQTASEPAAEIIRQIDDWIAANPYQRGIHWISALESGTRAVSWILAYPFFSERCDAAFRRRWLVSLAEHMRFVERHLSFSQFANTHLVGEAATLVVGGLFLDCRHSARWVETGLRILEREIQRQVTADGVHAEQSVSYHRFFLDHYYLVAALLAARGKSFSTATLARMEAMTRFLMHVVFPNGSAPAFGDGDSARGLWVHAGAAGDYRALLALGAVLFDRADFKAVAGPAPEELLWLFGRDGVRRYGALAAQLPQQTSVGFSDAGYYVLREGWGAEDAMLVFDCGPLGFGPAAHGHADALSVQLCVAGYPYFVDAGTFSYNLDPSWRDAFRGTRAHNTVDVDGLEQSTPGGRMAWRSTAKANLRQRFSSSRFDLVEGEHDGYLRLTQPVGHRRAVVAMKPDAWMTLDVLEGPGSHRLELWLHAAPDCLVQVDERRATLTSPAGRSIEARICDDTGDSRGFELVVGDDSERSAWFSPSYGTKVPSRALRFARQFHGSIRVVTCIAAAASQRPSVTFERAGAVGFHVERAHGRRESLWYVTDGQSLRCAGGIDFEGILLFRETQDERIATVHALRCRSLAIVDFLEIRSAATIDQVIYDDGVCEISIDSQDTESLYIRAPENVRVAVNGRPVPRFS
jgi:hypothetical protein